MAQNKNYCAVSSALAKEIMQFEWMHQCDLREAHITMIFFFAQELKTMDTGISFSLYHLLETFYCSEILHIS